ncbi:MAG TPA: hypothetical protein VHL61_10905 [Luteimonas sp.]|nr:hypothetical protein [Luteimonas sp.]
MERSDTIAGADHVPAVGLQFAPPSGSANIGAGIIGETPVPLSWNEIKDRARRFSHEWADEASEDAEAKSEAKA